MAILDFATLGTDHLTDLLATEDTLEQVLAVSRLECRLKAIEEKVEELLCILLLRGDRRGTVKFFEREAEGERIVVHAFAKLQVRKETLHLMEHVVIDYFVLVLNQLLRLFVICT